MEARCTQAHWQKKKLKMNGNGEDKVDAQWRWIGICAVPVEESLGLF